jgi:hypothetical protein
MHRRIVVRVIALSMVFTWLSGTPVTAQNLTVLDPDHVQLITQEVSGDASYEHIRYLSQFHRPRGGADGLWVVAEYYAEKAREYGLSDVTLIKQSSTTRPWNARFADLWIVEPTPERLASTLQTRLHLADYSRSADITGELIDIAGGTPADYEGKDVSGKVVLTHGSISAAMQEAVLNRGALGVVWYPDPFTPMLGTVGAGVSRPDQIRWNSLPSESVNGREPTFAFVLSLRQGVALRNRLSQAETPIRVRAVVDASFDSEQGSEPWQVMVEAFIRGTEPDLGQDVVLTGHLQEEGTSANDDASGTANVAEIARSFNKLINEGRLPRPRRNLRFWWVTEISSQRQYFADHPDAHEQMWVNVNQDMVGANQAQDVMRKQAITRLPATRFHFFNDVVESVIDYMVTANTFELAQAQAGSTMYPKAYMTSLGTQHRYNASVVFNHNSTDHMTFNETPIGVPGVTFTNMPDRFIHSTDDDLWNIDRTQLGRNAVSVALMAYTMANADSPAVSELAAQTVGRGAERLGQNLRVALLGITSAADKVTAYHQALDQISYATERERMALESLAEIHPDASDVVGPLVEELDRRASEAVRQVELTYRQASGQRRLPGRQLNVTERNLRGMTPVVISGPAEFLTGRNRVSGVPGLHGLMSFEVMNAIDGERSGLDIYRFVAAEAREAGAHYYGVVTADDVLQYLQNAAVAGLVRLD